MPLRVVANGVVTRSVRDTAAFYREAERMSRNPKLPPIGDVTRPDKQRLRIAVCTQSLFARRQSGGPRADPQDGGAARRTRPPRPSIDNPRCPTLSTTTSCCTGRCWLSRWCATEAHVRREFRPQPSWTTSPSDSSVTPPATCTGCRWPSRGCARPRRITARLFQHLRRGADADAGRRRHRRSAISTRPPTIEQIIDRLIDWVAFTPLQNATGDPAISLPLAESAEGLPVGMMFCAAAGDEARLLELAYELEEARPWARIR